MSGSEPLPHERYYIHISNNTHNKRKLTLSKTANNTKTILKPIPMIFLLKNAPHSLPKPEYSESDTVIKLYRGSNQPNVVVYADAGDVWFYFHGNISQNGNEKEARRTLKAKYDYQCKKLGLKPGAILFSRVHEPFPIPFAVSYTHLTYQ